MKKIIIIGVALPMVGCASAPGLYAEIGLGYKIRETTSIVLLPECHVVVPYRQGENPDTVRDRKSASCGGDNPTAQFSVGYEFNQHNRIEYFHESHLLDGGPNRETHMDQFRYIRRWGGLGD